jgi:pantothenate kinase
MQETTQLINRIDAVPGTGLRRLIALVGPPASGKSTLAEALSAQIKASCVIPMDGFHLDNSDLDAHGLRDRKGSPDTFDVAGFVDLVDALATQPNVSYPLFDREKDRSVPNAAQVGPEVDTVIVEGNYLLLDAPGWRKLHDKWDFSIALKVPIEELEKRLMARWTGLGLSHADAAIKTHHNDLPNAKSVLVNSISADVTFTNY